MSKERPKIGVAVIVIKDSKILLGLRRSEHGKGTWALPGGHMEHGEDPRTTAIRELDEETGLKASNLEFCGLTNDLFESGKHYITLFFMAEAEGEPEVMEPEKCERWEWFAPRSLPSPLFLPFKNLSEGNVIYASGVVRGMFGY